MSANNIMSLSYHSQSRDFVEVSARHFFRTKSARQIKIRNTITSGAFAVFFTYFLIQRDPSLIRLAISLIVALIGGMTLGYFTFESDARSRLLKYARTEFGEECPLTTYTIQEGYLNYSGRGTDVIFNLADLVSVSEDHEWLEIDFGSRGLCIIPLRAFSDNEHKHQFTKKLNAYIGVRN
jgi:hypothetical protein